MRRTTKKRKTKMVRNKLYTRNKTKKVNYIFKNKNRDPLQKINCSPKDKNEVNDFTCYTDKSLYKLRDLWNARHSDQKINTNNTKDIHHFLTKYLKNVCNRESCWLKQRSDFGKINDDMMNSFAPASPDEWKKNPNEWLTSLDIIKVMKQYEKAYKCFEFIGPSPIDFDKKKIYGECVWEELCNFNLEKQIKNGKTKIGIIFNTDPSDKPGQHWISLFINIKKKLIFFFDSTGDEAPKQVMAFINRVIEQGRKLYPTINFKFDSNKGIEHQYGNTECGIYSLFFIVHMLEDKLTDHYIKTHILKDEYMQKFRKIYFNDSL